MTGLPPAPSELDAFLADTSPAARARVVDRLLETTDFAERMAGIWLDNARYVREIRNRARPARGADSGTWFRFVWKWRLRPEPATVRAIMNDHPRFPWIYENDRAHDFHGHALRCFLARQCPDCGKRP